jgi:hypothetical protein
MNMLYNGASAMAMSVGEPYSVNIAFGSETFHMLVNQRVPLALANFYAPTAGSAVLGGSVFGDPLYAPFFTGFPPSYAVGKGLIGGLKIGVS